MSKIQIQSHVSPEVYQQLQTYMTERGLSETTAIETIVSSYLAEGSQDELRQRIAKIEQDLSVVKRHVLAIRFRSCKL
jgi:hypothetical protein